MVTVLLTVLGSVVASLVAVVLASHLQNRSSASERRREVYESFTTSATILVGRAVLLSEANSVRQQMSSAVYAAGSVLGSLLLWWKWGLGISASDIAGLLKDGMNSTMSYQTPLQQALPSNLIIEAAEDLMRQRVRVLSVGSDNIKVAADNVVSQARRLTELADSPSRLSPFTIKREGNKFSAQLNELRDAVERFTELAKNTSG